jgi:hypothetical protein
VQNEGRFDIVVPDRQAWTPHVIEARQGGAFDPNKSNRVDAGDLVELRDVIDNLSSFLSEIIVSPRPADLLRKRLRGRQLV